MLGIMVGTASVVALVSGGALATQQALEQVKSLGTDLMRIDFSSKDFNSPQPINIGLLLNIRTAIPGILQIAPMANFITTLVYQKKSLDSIQVIGTTENLKDIVHIPIQSGRFIYDLDEAQHFCVLGGKVAAKLNSVTLLGENLKLESSICKVVGITDTWPVNNMVGLDLNQSVIVPLSAVLQMSSNILVSSAILQLKENADIDTIKQAITDYFKRYIPRFNLNIQSSKELLNSIEKQRTIFSLLLGLIGGVSLLVGGIGVMNIMLASVAERHSEIGLRIALGAKPRDVQMMFLMEAATLATLGGGFGVIFGIFATTAIAYFAGWPFVILIWPPLIGFSVSLLISLFFGFYPAYVASKLNPIETLRA